VNAKNQRTFDGIVCFGGLDWWYHNRGHYDLQMMRELSAYVPVLYVNSIAMRIPRLDEGRMFAKRILRKWKSLRRGLVRVRPGFGVYSPFVVPGALGTALSGRIAPWQVRRAARRMGVRRPLVWVACPPAERFLDHLDAACVVYQRTDRFEAFAGVDPVFIGACNAALERRADLTLFCSHLLMEEDAPRCAHPLFLDHGVDFEAFERAGRAADEPGDVRSIPRPRVGFVGGIDAHTFDPELFVESARLLPDVHFVLVGSCSLPAGWCPLPNVHLLGQRPYEEVARYMAASDVLVMPWNRSEWVRACNPVKLKEYLAVGRPVVSTDFHELRSYAGLVQVAHGPEAFAQAIRAALARPPAPEAGRERVRHETWQRKAREFLDRLADDGIIPSSSSPG
jgi:glycosyltransferase involved in cell wall biosynthesis